MKFFKKPKGLHRKVIVSDPDATDDSSSDECPAKPRNIKRIFHEDSKISENRCNGDKTSRKKSPRQRMGVRLRPYGKYGAEIRNPIIKTYKWLGTHETFQEAAKAYVDKKAEYKTLAASGSSVSSLVVSKTSLNKELVARLDDSNKDLCVKVDLMDFDAKGAGLDFDFFPTCEYEHLLDDYSLLNNDINISRCESNFPTEPPDCYFTDVNFELGWFEN